MGVSSFACVHRQWDTAMRKELPENGYGLRDECAKRFQQWVREKVPSGARKTIARSLGASPETVDVWLGSSVAMDDEVRVALARAEEALAKAQGTVGG